jgi:hypothetical protein
MPGFPRWRPEEEPFSYWKLCLYYVPGSVFLLWMVALLISMFGGLPSLWPWLDEVGRLLPSSAVLRVAMGAIFLAGYYLFFMKVLWSLLPARIRARIPYDRQEAIQEKGDIRSLWDLRKVIFHNYRDRS